MFRKILSQFSTLHLKKNFRVDDIQDIEIITRDYKGSLKNILKTLYEHKVNLSNLETNKLNRTTKGQQAFFRLSFDSLEQKQLQEFIYDLKQKYDHVTQPSESSVPVVPWYPKDDEDLKTIGTMMEVKDEVNKDHPQFSDKVYRQRREHIAQISKSHEVGQPVPLIDYTAQEQETWIKIYKILREKCNNVMSQRFLKNLSAIEQELGFKHKIPQLRDIDYYLQAKTGFRLKATSGILSSREFLNALAHKVFPCTQYIRHHATPEYTPEPDIVHELIGHVPMFADQEVADLSQEIGKLSCGCAKNDLTRLGTLYWFTLEYGTCKENGQIKGYGAGIASSIGECDHFPSAKFEKFDPFLHSTKEYPIQTYQPTYLYTESFEEAFEQLLSFGQTLKKPFNVYYDVTAKKLRSDKRIQTHLNDQ